MPCKASRARILLKKGRAKVHKLYPFTICLLDRIEGETQPVALKLDPGAETTGLAIVRQHQKDPSKQIVLHFAEVSHRGKAIRKHIIQRAMFRRRRRGANLRYRAPRFDNRTKPKGWLPPSLQSRIENVTSLVRRYRAVAPISSISVEAVRFDMQKLENPEISGIEYQQGTLAGYEAREYLLEKWGRKCAYCDAENVLLEIDHIRPKGRRGSDRISNLTLACRPCNEAKGCQPVELFLASKPERLKQIRLKGRSMLLLQSIAPGQLLLASCAQQGSRSIPARVGAQSLIGKPSDFQKLTPWMLLVWVMSQVWEHGICKHFVSKRQGADLTDGLGSTATVFHAAI